MPTKAKEGLVNSLNKVRPLTFTSMKNRRGLISPSAIEPIYDPSPIGFPLYLFM